MIQLTTEEFKKAREAVDNIINAPDTSNIESEIERAAQDIPSEKKRAFLNHMNSLFLNILLNRLDELGESARNKSFKARKAIKNKFDNINSKSLIHWNIECNESGKGICRLYLGKIGKWSIDYS